MEGGPVSLTAFLVPLPQPVLQIWQVGVAVWGTAAAHFSEGMAQPVPAAGDVL